MVPGSVFFGQLYTQTSGSGPRRPRQRQHGDGQAERQPGFPLVYMHPPSGTYEAPTVSPWYPLSSPRPQSVTRTNHHGSLPNSLLHWSLTLRMCSPVFPPSLTAAHMPHSLLAAPHHPRTFALAVFATPTSHHPHQLLLSEGPAPQALRTPPPPGTLSRPNRAPAMAELIRFGSPDGRSSRAGPGSLPTHVCGGRRASRCPAETSKHHNPGGAFL